MSDFCNCNPLDLSTLETVAHASARLRFCVFSETVELLSRFRDRGSRPQPSTFFTEIISCITDLKFTGEGRYLLTRDYMNLKVP